MKMVGITFSVVFALFIAIGPTSPAGANPAWDSAMLELAPNFGSLCGYCSNCEEPGFHELTDEHDWDRMQNELPHDCSATWSQGWCPLAHPATSPCSGGSLMALDKEQQAEFIRILDSGSETELVAMMERFGESVTFNSSRSAVQALACDGETVILSMPVSGAQLAALQDE